MKAKEKELNQIYKTFPNIIWDIEEYREDRRGLDLVRNYIGGDVNSKKPYIYISVYGDGYMIQYCNHTYKDNIVFSAWHKTLDGATRGFKQRLGHYKNQLTNI